jgi:hypothetical protein
MCVLYSKYYGVYRANINNLGDKKVVIFETVAGKNMKPLENRKKIH